MPKSPLDGRHLSTRLCEAGEVLELTLKGGRERFVRLGFLRRPAGREGRVMAGTHEFGEDCSTVEQILQSHALVLQVS